MADRKLVARDRGQERFRAAQPFAVAFAAFFDFPGSLVRRGHGASIASQRVPVETGTRRGRRYTERVRGSVSGGPAGFYARAVCCSVSIVTLGSFWKSENLLPSLSTHAANQP